MTTDEERAKIVCREMIIARNYKICYEDESNIVAKHNKQLVYVYFIDQNLNIKVAKEYFILIQTNKIKHCIIVYSGTLTPSARKSFEAFYNVRLELFSVDELQFNITKHTLVPNHQSVRKGDENCSKFPVLKSTDPVAKFYGFMSGELVRITRKNGSITYRIVR